MVSEKLQEYRLCMKENLPKIKTKDKLERKLLFCSFAKLCSKKFSDLEDAKKNCLEAHPQWRT